MVCSGSHAHGCVCGRASTEDDWEVRREGETKRSGRELHRMVLMGAFLFCLVHEYARRKGNNGDSMKEVEENREGARSKGKEKANGNRYAFEKERNVIMFD